MLAALPGPSRLVLAGVSTKETGQGLLTPLQGLAIQVLLVPAAAAERAGEAQYGMELSALVEPARP